AHTILADEINWAARLNRLRSEVVEKSCAGNRDRPLLDLLSGREIQSGNGDGQVFRMLFDSPNDETVRSCATRRVHFNLLEGSRGDDLLAIKTASQRATVKRLEC